MTNASATAHTNSITRIFPRLGETGATIAHGPLTLSPVSLAVVCQKIRHLCEIRLPADRESARSIEEIACEEIQAALVQEGGPNPVIQIARAFGNKRLSTASRERIERAIELTK